jgi:hypothetical protein
MKPELRLLLIGIVVAVLGLLISPLIMLGQAVGIRFSDIELHLLFWVTIGVVAIGLLIILIAAGAFRWLRHFQSPITIRSLMRRKPDPANNATQVAVSGRFFGGPAGGSHLATNWPLELNKLQVQIQGLETELRQFGNDATSRRLLKLAMDELPKLSFGFLKDVAGLFYAAHQQPRTDFVIEFKAQDKTQSRALVGIPAINRSLDLPYGEAMLVADQLRGLIRKIQNDSINEAKRLQQP